MKTPLAFHHSAQGCPRRAGYPGNAGFNFHQPQRGCITGMTERSNPVGVENHFAALTQGSRSSPGRLGPPTLGWMTLPRWGNAATADVKHFHWDNICPNRMIKLRA